MIVDYKIDERMLILKINEELDHHITERIRRRADYEIQRFMPRKVILDFNRVVFMDSAGVGFIIGRYKTTHNFGGEMELINVGKNVKRILEMSGVHKIVNILEEQENEKISNL